MDELRELDARSVVEAIVASRRAADQHEARLLGLAVQLVDLHPVAPGQRAASWDPDEALPATSVPRHQRLVRTGRSGRALCPHRPN
jgi:hypothetical protein